MIEGGDDDEARTGGATGAGLICSNFCSVMSKAGADVLRLEIVFVLWRVFALALRGDDEYGFFFLSSNNR